jgi:ADP-ribosylglycohydrolase
MNHHASDKLAGLVYGSFIADALALGAHWIYDQEELRRDFGRVTHFLDPREDSYHPSKKRGEQTHYGDQALTLMESIKSRGRFDVFGFAQDWSRMWDGYPDYFDQATKETLKHLNAGTPAKEAASNSNELGGAARIAPLLALMSGDSVECAVAAARAQTALTHSSYIAGDAAEFLTRIVFALLAGAELRASIEQAAGATYDELDVRAMLQRVEATRSLELAAAAKSLGLACPAPQALPTLLMLLDRCGDDFEKALIENTNAGGDNAARGLALGMVLGAMHGKSRIPERWLRGLRTARRLDAFLHGLPSRATYQNGLSSLPHHHCGATGRNGSELIRLLGYDAAAEELETCAAVRQLKKPLITTPRASAVSEAPSITLQRRP